MASGVVAVVVWAVVAELLPALVPTICSVATVSAFLAAACLAATGTPSSEARRKSSSSINGTCAVTKALLPLLVAARPEANIVNLTSSVGRAGRAHWGPYSASKFVVESLTQTWAQELAQDGIRVNALNPGETRTAMRAEAMPDEDPLSLPAPAQVVPSVLFLLSPQSRDAKITGRSFNSAEFM